MVPTQRVREINSLYIYIGLVIQFVLHGLLTVVGVECVVGVGGGCGVGEKSSKRETYAP